jgi:hypothetical protein
MAQIVLGLGTSHSPQLSPPDLWRNHGERDKRNPDLHKPDGRVYTYEEILASVRPSRKNSPQTSGKHIMMPARRASPKWVQSSRMSLLMSW